MLAWRFSIFEMWARACLVVKIYYITVFMNGYILTNFQTFNEGFFCVRLGCDFWCFFVQFFQAAGGCFHEEGDFEDVLHDGDDVGMGVWRFNFRSTSSS